MDGPVPSWGGFPVVTQAVPTRAHFQPGSGAGRFSVTVQVPAVRFGIVPVPAFWFPGWTVRLTVDVALVGLVTV